MENKVIAILNAVLSFSVMTGAIFLYVSLGRYKANQVARAIRWLPLCLGFTSGALAFYLSFFPGGDWFWILRAGLTAITTTVLWGLGFYFSGYRIGRGRDN